MDTSLSGMSKCLSAAGLELEFCTVEKQGRGLERKGQESWKSLKESVPL